MNLTIGVQYSCNGCGIRNVEVQIPAREAEDVGAWMRNVLQPGLGADHLKRSPRCRSETCDVKIPMAAGSDRVGGATAQ